MGHMWFSCARHGSDVVQVCVVQCCGSVVCGMVQMWLCSGSVVVRMCVWHGVCGPVLWFSCAWCIASDWCGHNVYGSLLVQLGLDLVLMVVLHWFSLAWHGVLQFTFGVDVGQVSGGVASGSMVSFGLGYGSVGFISGTDVVQTVVASVSMVEIWFRCGSVVAQLGMA